MKILLSLFLVLSTSISIAQSRQSEPFKKADRIIVINENDAKTNFKTVITTLLENGYSIDRKDDEYLTIKTQNRSTKTKGIYFFNLWSKDSLIIITGMVDANIEVGTFIKTKSTFVDISNIGMNGAEYKKAFAIMKTFAGLLPGTAYYEKK